MRAKTAEVLDSAEAEAHPRARHQRAQWHAGHGSGQWPQPPHKPALTLGNAIHFTIAVFLLWPIFIFIAAIWSLGDAINFIRHSVEACISSTFWLGRLGKEWVGRMYLHQNSPGMQRLIGQRKAFGAEAAKDWREAKRALVNIGRAWSRTFGLGGLFKSLEQRIQHANQDWRRYVATQAYDNTNAPVEFPEQYVVVDELPRGGSSARLYVVRKADEPQGRLHVLKYFDLRAGGNLESVVRESQAAQLAQKLGLIVESRLGESAFWYVMPYYSGETLTAGVMRNIKAARDNGTLNEHYHITLGYVHQLLQIIAQYHEAGVFHKDIKPDNLIINGEKIYLVDIGLMTPLSSMAQLTTHGTEYFRDPEMVKLALEGREVREVDAAKFDVYSIGAVLFFAMSGEFPTSGALSRLPREVPTAGQWVVNRAMTGMHQRYANARAMLTDIDYLTWAASQGKLDEVKPADLPSFRGMPVPPHLDAPQPKDDTEWRDKLSAAPGGYGAWYAAPQYQPKRRSTWAVALSVVLVFSVISATLLGGVMLLIGTRAPYPQATIVSDAERRNGGLPTLQELLPEGSEYGPIYRELQEEIDDPIRFEFHEFGAAPGPLELPGKAVLAADEYAAEVQQRVRKQIRSRSARELFATKRFVYLSVERDEGDKALAEGLENNMNLEAARRGLDVAPWEPGQLERVRSLASVSLDAQALHRELAAQYASRGELPPYLVAISIVDAENRREIRLRVIYPGYEHIAGIPLQAEAAALHD